MEKKKWYIRHWFLSILILLFLYYIGNMMYLYNNWTNTLIEKNGELKAPLSWEEYYNSH